MFYYSVSIEKKTRFHFSAEGGAKSERKLKKGDIVRITSTRNPERNEIARVCTAWDPVKHKDNEYYLNDKKIADTYGNTIRKLYF